MPTTSPSSAAAWPSAKTGCASSKPALRGSWRSAGATQYSAGLVLRKGLDAFGAGLQAEDLVDDPRRVDFLLAQLTGTVYRRFATDWSTRLDAFAQHTRLRVAGQ